MARRIDMKSALIGLLAGVILLLVFGAGFSGKEVETYSFHMLERGGAIVFARMNTTTGQIETWKHTETQIPLYRDGTRLEEPKY